MATSSLLTNWIPGYSSAGETAKTVTLWLSAAFSVTYLAYSAVIWRLVYPAYDINGRWKYKNEYATPVDDGQNPPMATSEGWLEIRQSLDSITYRGARTHRNGVHDTKIIDFRALAFDVADDSCAVLLYEVRRKVTVRSMEELRIQIVKAGEAPGKIRGRFRSLEPEPTYMGVAVYTYERPCTLVDRTVERLRKWIGKSRDDA